MNHKNLNLAYKLRHALDESAGNISPKAADRLAIARGLAISRKKQEGATAVLSAEMGTVGAPAGFSFHPFAWIGRMSMVLPLAFLVFGLMGIYEYEQRQQILDSAAIDAEVLTDDLPLSAYLDNGFDAFLAKGED